MFEVVLSPSAREFFEHADGPLARKLGRCFEQLERDPYRHPNIKRLAGELAGRFRYRVGDWRVIYAVDEKSERVLISVIAHRREAYE